VRERGVSKDEDGEIKEDGYNKGETIQRARSEKERCKKE